jgi:hypothetical protein
MSDRDFEKLFKCDNWSDLESLIKYKIFSTSHVWGGIVEVRGVEMMMKVAAYTRWFTLDPKNIPTGAEHHVSTEISMLWEIRKRVIEQNYSSAFVEIMYSRNCPLPAKHEFKFQELDSGSLKSVLRRGQNVDVSDVALILLEKCTMTFKKFVPRLLFAQEISLFKSVLFTLIHGWHVLHLVIPDFRHGDTHDENFMVKINPGAGMCDNPPVDILYALGKTYAIPYFGITPKVIDFDHAKSEALGIVTYTANMRSVNMFDNELARLFHELTRRLPKIRGQSEFSVGALQLLYQISPRHSYVEDIDVINDKFPTTDEMLRCEPFQEYVLADSILEGDAIRKALPACTTIRHIYRPPPHN